MKRFDKIYIDGAWVPSSGKGSIEVVNAATEEVMATIPEGVTADVDRAVSAAREAFESWSQTSPEERAGYLRAIQAGITARQEELATTIASELGMPLAFASSIQVGLPAIVAGSFAKLLDGYVFEETIGNSLVVKEPVGVVGCITPWNYPLHQIIAKVAAALAAGCTIVLKPSEVAPVNAFLLTEIIHEAKLPKGVFNLVSGTGPVVGEAIALHPQVDMVSFTGSTGAGKRVSEIAARSVKRVALELGGKSASIVLSDADLAKAVRTTVNNSFLNSGQTCSAWTRLLVPRDKHDEAVAIAKEVAEKFTVGDPLGGKAKLGPLVSATQRDRVRAYIRKGVEEGATLVAGGPEAPEGFDKGFYVRPTVFANVRNDMTIAREEIFGPVLSILPYEDEEDAIRIANDSDYGLAGGVFSADAERAKKVARRLRTGQVDINGGRFNPVAPFGGYKQSGHGREFGKFGLEEFFEIKAMQL